MKCTRTRGIHSNEKWRHDRDTNGLKNTILRPKKSRLVRTSCKSYSSKRRRPSGHINHVFTLTRYHNDFDRIVHELKSATVVLLFILLGRKIRLRDSWSNHISDKTSRDHVKYTVLREINTRV